MRNFKYILSITFIFLLANASFAQSNSMILAGDKLITVNYSAGMPTGDLHKFIDKKIFGGLNVDYRSFLTEKISAGFSIGWNSFKQKYPRETYPNGNGSFSSVQTKFLYTVPVLITGNYYFSTRKKINPYSTLAAGIHLVNYNKWDGVFLNKKTAVTFGARAGGGILIPFKDTFGLNLSATYNYAAFSYNEIKNLQYLDISLGLYFISF